MISIADYNNSLNHSKYVNFQHNFRKSDALKNQLPDVVDIGFDKLSQKSMKLMKALNLYIETAWTGIKKGKIIQSSPCFSHSDENMVYTIRPIYSQKVPMLLIETDDGKINQRIFLNRQEPEKFRYEKMAYTEFGSATLKSYNSETGNNKEINIAVDRLITEKFPRIIPVKILRNFFSRDCFKKLSNGEWYLI